MKFMWPPLVSIFLPPAMKLEQGNIFRSMCQQFCPWGGACVVAGVCAWFYLGGHAWFYLGGHAWFYSGGMHGFIWGVCMVLFRGGMRGFFSFFGYNEIRSMSGQYASYWNVFLL